MKKWLIINPKIKNPLSLWQNLLIYKEEGIYYIYSYESYNYQWRKYITHPAFHKTSHSKLKQLIMEFFPSYYKISDVLSIKRLQKRTS